MKLLFLNFCGKKRKSIAGNHPLNVIVFTHILTIYGINWPLTDWHMINDIVFVDPWIQSWAQWWCLSRHIWSCWLEMHTVDLFSSSLWGLKPKEWQAGLLKYCINFNPMTTVSILMMMQLMPVLTASFSIIKVHLSDLNIFFLPYYSVQNLEFFFYLLKFLSYSCLKSWIYETFSS